MDRIVGTNIRKNWNSLEPHCSIQLTSYKGITFVDDEEPGSNNNDIISIIPLSTMQFFSPSKILRHEVLEILRLAYPTVSPTGLRNRMKFRFIYRCFYTEIPKQIGTFSNLLLSADVFSSGR